MIVKTDCETDGSSAALVTCAVCSVAAVGAGAAGRDCAAPADGRHQLRGAGQPPAHRLLEEVTRCRQSTHIGGFIDHFILPMDHLVLLLKCWAGIGTIYSLQL